MIAPERGPPGQPGDARPEPCPFCRAPLAYHKGYWRHDMSDCWLSKVAVAPALVPLWNRRAP